MRFTIFIAAVLTLAACGSQEPSADTVDIAVANADATAKAAEKKEADAPKPAEPAEPATAIPAGFQGRWGLTANDCDLVRSDTKGLMTVSNDLLTFYESRAKLTKMIASSPEKLEGVFAFSGEGQEWTKTETLTLAGSSNALVRTEDGKDLHYKRCPVEGGA